VDADREAKRQRTTRALLMSEGQIVHARRLQSRFTSAIEAIHSNSTEANSRGQELEDHVRRYETEKAQGNITEALEKSYTERRRQLQDDYMALIREGQDLLFELQANFSRIQGAV
jgi:hypothetical protein